MMMRRLHHPVALLLVLCILGVSGIASAQTVLHDSHHAHHQTATHGTVLCSWMCAAGQMLDTVAGPCLVERSPVAQTEHATIQTITSVFAPAITSRGPPSHSKI